MTKVIAVKMVRLVAREKSRLLPGVSKGPRPLSTRVLAALALVSGLMVSLSACGNIEPWVKPYERQALADPIMAANPNPVSSSYMDHVFEAREGARGALGGGGGGCGCN